MTCVIEVTAAILIREQKVLIAQRPEGDPLAGFWEFPGGKIEAGESPEECLAREMKEEFGIGVAVGGFFGSSLYAYPDKVIRLLAYVCQWIDGDICSTSHASYAWPAVEDLRHYDFAPADLPLVEALKTGLPL